MIRRSGRLLPWEGRETMLFGRTYAKLHTVKSICGRSILFWLFLLLLITAVVVIGCWSLKKSPFFGGAIIVISVEDGTELTEELAVAVSKQAMHKTGYYDPDLRPITFDDQNYFARNVYDPNNGYVIWAWPDSRKAGYTVHIERDGTSVKCSVGRNK